MDITKLYQVFLRCQKVCTDSRQIEKNSIFFALKGENFNGNKFAATAIENGCILAVIDEKEYYKDEHYLLVDNVLECLQQLANYHRKQINIPVLAITGTNGKTTTKELITNVLKRKFNLISTKGNLNNHIGVPLTLLNISADTEFAIVEMGANHLEEIKQLCEIAAPNYGIITNIGKAHLEGFGSLEGVIKTKAELYDFLLANNGIVFYNNDNGILKNLITNHKTVSYSSLSSQSDCIGTFEEADPYITVKWTEKKCDNNFPKKWHICKTKLIGNYNFENILAAICVGIYFGINESDINSAIESYEPLNSRSQLLIKEKNTIILDAYNANPSSMQAAIQNFSSIPNANKVLILGDMLELGSTSNEEHEYIIQLLESLGFDKVYLVGKYFGTAAKTFPAYNIRTFKTVKDFNDYLIESPIESSYILVKGSRGIQMEKVVEFL